MLQIFFLIIIIFSLYHKNRSITDNDDVDNTYKMNIFKQIKNNITNIKKKNKLNKKFGLVMKYGYPIIQYIISSFGKNAIYKLAKYLEDEVDYYYIGNIFDGIELRKINITKPIIVLYYIKPHFVQIAEKYNLEIIVPNIKWLNLALPYIKNFVKVHLWFDSNMGKEGNHNQDDFIKFFNLIISCYKIKLTGIGTKYNTSDISFKNNIKKFNKIPNDLIIQHNKFKKLLKEIPSYFLKTLNIHVACTFEFDHNFNDSHFNSVRIGTLVYRNIKLLEEILDVKYVNGNSCYGYYCNETKDKFKNKKLKIALIKRNLYIKNQNENAYKIFNQKESNKELEVLYLRYDPSAIIIDNTNLNVGDKVVIIYNDLYSYPKVRKDNDLFL